MAVILAAKRLRPKTYSIGIYLVIFTFLAEVIALVSIPYFRRISVRVETAPPAAVASDSGSSVIPSIIPHKISSLSEPIPTLRPVAPLRSGRLNVNTVAAPVDNRQTIMALNDEASRFRRQGEYKLAAAALHKAEDLDPREPITLTGLAMLMDAQNEPIHARAYWQRVIDLGPEIGNAYTLAREQVIIIGSREHLSDGSPDSHVLFVDQVEKTPSSTTNKQNEFSMKVTISPAETGPVIDPGKVLIKLYFFEKSPDDSIVASVGKLKVAFQGDTQMQNWAKKAPETLVADYALTPDLMASYKRQYYGYMLRIFYDGKLQDERAEPEDLLHLFPLPNPPKPG